MRFPRFDKRQFRAIYLNGSSNPFIGTLIGFHENGKPVVKPGRKAMGLVRDRQAAEGCLYNKLTIRGITVTHSAASLPSWPFRRFNRDITSLRPDVFDDGDVRDMLRGGKGDETSSSITP